MWKENSKNGRIRQPHRKRRLGDARKGRTGEKKKRNREVLRGGVPEKVDPEKTEKGQRLSCIHCRQSSEFKPITAAHLRAFHEDISIKCENYKLGCIIFNK